MELAVVSADAEEKKKIIADFQDLLEVLRPSLKEGGEERVTKAFKMAARAHDGMRRKSGEPYILHPIAVAMIVAKEQGLGATSVICALLHDVVEDTDVSLEEIENAFNPEIKSIVDGLTKIKGVTNKKQSVVASQAENLKKVLLTMSNDVRVIVIKIADRVHNMRTMKSMPERKQVRIASETLYLYAPLAHRLGLYAMKTELEDLSLKYTMPEIYKDIAKKLSQTKRSRDAFIKEFIEPVKDLLEEKEVKNFDIFGRSKSIHSIWNKMRKKHVEFEDIYDLFAIRVVLDVPEEEEKAECWKVYSIMTDIYRPIVERLRDWISNPKSNGYESLHTTVMGPKGRLVEVQIRTKRMDMIAEKGVAAHWKYKGSSKTADNNLDAWLNMVREVLANPDENAVAFMSDFKHNLYDKDLFVFTPKGELKTLRGGSTVLDFAYSIHTAIGGTCIGAKINNKLVPLSHVLGNGDQVEILTSKKQKPSDSWLQIAVTSSARSKIRTAIKDEMRVVALDGKEMFKRKLKSLKTPYSEELVNELTSYFKQGSSLAFFYNIATKKFDLNELKQLTFAGGRIQNIVDRGPQRIHPDADLNQGIGSDIDLMIFGGLDNVDYSTAKCCTPKAGDSVFGFITISQGIKIHRTACPNAKEMKGRYPYRIVNVKWNKDSDDVAFLVGLRIRGIDEVGLVHRITSIVSNKLNVNMRSISFDTQDNVFEGRLTVFVKNNMELNRLIEELKRDQGVHDVKRYDL